MNKVTNTQKNSYLAVRGVALGGGLLFPDGVALLLRGADDRHMAGSSLGDHPPGLGNLLLGLELLQHLGADQPGPDQLGSLGREDGGA